MLYQSEYNPTIAPPYPIIFDAAISLILLFFFRAAERFALKAIDAGDKTADESVGEEEEKVCVCKVSCAFMVNEQNEAMMIYSTKGYLRLSKFFIYQTYGLKYSCICI